MIGLLPPWLLPATIAALALTNCATHNRLQSEQAAHATSRASYAEQVATAHQTRAAEEAKRRATEQELTDAQQTHSQEVATLRSDLDAGRAAAGVAAVRLRDTARATAERAGAQCAAATTAELRASAGDAIGVLAHVFERADERAGVLGAIAEERGIAGRACERAYDTAREALSR